MLKIRRPLGRLIFNMGIAIPGKTVFLIETAPWCLWIYLSISDAWTKYSNTFLELHFFSIQISKFQQRLLLMAPLTIGSSSGNRLVLDTQQHFTLKYKTKMLTYKRVVACVNTQQHFMLKYRPKCWHISVSWRALIWDWIMRIMIKARRNYIISRWTVCYKELRTSISQK